MIVAQAGIVLIGIVIIGLGVVQLVFRDFTWKVDKTWHEMNGAMPRQSDAWDMGRVVRGIFFILAGLGAIWLATTLP